MQLELKNLGKRCKLNMSMRISMTIFSKAKVLVTATSADIFGDVLQLVFATLIVVLGVCVVIDGVKKLLGKDEEIETEPEKISEKVN